MTEWQILDSDNFSDMPPDDPEPEHARPWWRWLLLAAGILAFLLLVGLLTLRGQLDDGRTALRSDLSAVIFEEETQQLLGNAERANEFMLPTAPRTWQRAYRRLFSGADTLPPPGSAQLQEIDFDGRCAAVTVTLRGSPHLRSYCLHNEQWRRAPVPQSAFGRAQSVTNVTNGVQLHFRPRDRAFANALANDLQQFYADMSQWNFKPGAVARPPANADRPLEIIIEPQDLAPPLIANEPRRIVLNSPLLVVSNNALSGQSAVRLALAKILLSRNGPFVEISETSLPGSNNFLQAAHTVVAARSFLSADAQAVLRNEWQAQLGGQWVSPFFAKLPGVDSPASERQIEVAAYLIADYIYQTAGPTTLGVIIHQLPLANSWDRLFQRTLNRSTHEIEQEAAAYAQAKPGPDASLRANTLPGPAKLLKFDNLAAGGDRLYVEPSGHPHPVLVELPPQVNLRTAAGAFLPAGCALPGATLKIDGEWLEAGRRLRATQVTVQNIVPNTIATAPDDTVAYLIAGEIEAATNTIYPSTKSYLVARRASAEQALVAMRPNGTLQPLVGLTPSLQILPLPIPPGGEPHFLLVLDTATCGRSWFLHYRPGQGITGYWLAPLPPMQWVWRADHQDMMFFMRREGALGYEIYQSTGTLALEPVGNSAGTLVFLGWNTQSGRLVATNSWFGEVYIGLFDLQSGNIMPLVRPRYQPLRARRLSPDGSWLAYLAGIRNLFGPPDRLEVLNMLNDVESVLIQLEPGQGLEPPTWSLYWEQQALAVLAGPIGEDDRLQPARLLVAQPGRPDSVSVVAQAARGERLAMPVFCADGSLLYRAQQNGTYRLVRQPPGLRAQTLLTLNRPFQPLACP